MLIFTRLWWIMHNADGITYHIQILCNHVKHFELLRHGKAVQWTEEWMWFICQKCTVNGQLHLNLWQVCLEQYLKSSSTHWFHWNTGHGRWSSGIRRSRGWTEWCWTGGSSSPIETGRRWDSETGLSTHSFSHFGRVWVAVNINHHAVDGCGRFVAEWSRVHFQLTRSMFCFESHCTQQHNWVWADFNYYWDRMMRHAQRTGVRIRALFLQRFQMTKLGKDAPRPPSGALLSSGWHPVPPPPFSRCTNSNVNEWRFKISIKHSFQFSQRILKIQFILNSE